MILTLLVTLTVLSGLTLIVGSAWGLVTGGRTTRDSGEELGAEIFDEQLGDEKEITVYQKSAFRGKAGSVQRETSLSFAEIKRELKRGQWRKALPFLLAIGGFLGLLLFGSLVLLVAMEDKLIGSLIAAVTLFTVLRVLIRMVQA